MPQFVLTNKKHLTAVDCSALQAEPRGNIILARRQTSWRNSDFLVDVIRALALLLLPFKDTAHSILMFDASQHHVTRLVFAAAIYYGIFLCVFALALTWLLQPLDTDIFSKYRLAIRHSYASMVATRGTDNIPTRDFIRTLISIIDSFFQSAQWRPIFIRNGFSPSQSGVSERIKTLLGVAELPEINAFAPTEAQFRQILPSDVEPFPDLLTAPVAEHRRAEDILDRTT